VSRIRQAIKNGAKSEAFFLSAFFLLAFLSVFSLSGTFLPFLELTASWQAVLEYAAKSKLQFGRDIVFTYGPLGYLGTIYSQGHLAVQRIAFALAWAALTAWSATTIVQKLSGLPKGVFIVWVLFLFSRGGMDVQAYLVLACGYSILAEDVQQRKGISSIFIISFAVLAWLGAHQAALLVQTPSGHETCSAAPGHRGGKRPPCRLLHGTLPPAHPP